MLVEIEKGWFCSGARSGAAAHTRTQPAVRRVESMTADKAIWGGDFEMKERLWHRGGKTELENEPHGRGGRIQEWHYS